MLNLFDFQFGPLVLQVLIGIIGAGLVLFHRHSRPAWRVVVVLVAGVAGAFVVDFVLMMFALPLCGTSCANFGIDAQLHAILLASFVGAVAPSWMTARTFSTRV